MIFKKNTIQLHVANYRPQEILILINDSLPHSLTHRGYDHLRLGNRKNQTFLCLRGFRKRVM